MVVRLARKSPRQTITEYRRVADLPGGERLQRRISDGLPHRRNAVGEERVGHAFQRLRHHHLTLRIDTDHAVACNDRLSSSNNGSYLNRFDEVVECFVPAVHKEK